ncbi:MAG TPA: DUF448 domain-containing protein, partial [Miltoncostaeaceae bacterium]|nr:DUF448 domain-containing protein [Miltoncostaeaceae bacterium]
MSARDARHTPERRCLGCGATAPKRDLARFAAVRDGTEYVLMRDDGASHGGRGLYVCRRRVCFERAVARRGFVRGARIRGEITIDPDLAAGLDKEAGLGGGMGKKRIYEIAKGEGLPSSPVLQRLQRGGVP